MYDDVCTVVINDSTQYKINIAITIKGGSNDKMTNLEICVGAVHGKGFVLVTTWHGAGC